MIKKKINLYETLLNKSEISQVSKAIKSGWISSIGANLDLFSKKFSKFSKIKYCLPVNNGTSALHLAVKALNLKPGDKVMLPNFTYIACANVLSYEGLVPVFLDADKDTFQIDVNDLKKKSSKQIKALMLVHLYGNVSNLTEILTICKINKIKIIEDCSEAIGSYYKKKHVGNYSIASSFSFYGNKTISTGEGGMFCTNSFRVYKRIKQISRQGIGEINKKFDRYNHEVIGYNYRMTNICAAIGVQQMKKIKNILLVKKKIFLFYKSKLKGMPLKFIKTNFFTNNSYWLIVIKLNKKKTRDHLQLFLKKNFIETRRGFPLLSNYKMYKNYNNNEKFYNGKELQDVTLCLPSHPKLKKKNLEIIITKIKKFYDNQFN